MTTDLEQIEDLLSKMAIADLGVGPAVGKPDTKGPYFHRQHYSYTHLLPPHLAEAGYRLNVIHTCYSPKDTQLFAVLYHGDNKVGGITADTDEKSVKPDIASVDEKYRGKGLGQALYTALFAHAKNKMGLKYVSGSVHSTMASRVHAKISALHGMKYKPVPSGQKLPGDEAYDDAFGKYKYALKSEEELNKGMITSAIAGIALAASPMIQQATDIAAGAAKVHAEKSKGKKDAAKWTPVGLHDELHPIAHLESNFGLKTEHAPNTRGSYHTAHGAVGLKVVTAHEEWKRNKDMKARFPGLEEPAHFEKEFKTNHAMYNALASKHWKRIRKLTGTPEKAAFAWRFGLTAALRATDDEINDANYVKKFLSLLKQKQVVEIKKSEKKLDEPLEIEHYSPVDNIDSLDPKFQGTSHVRGQELARPKRVPRVYAYVAGTNPEAEVVGGLKAYKYKGVLPPGTRLYDFGEDGLKLMEPKWVKTKHGQFYDIPDLDDVEKELKSRGFHGYINYNATIPNAMALFYPVKVSKDGEFQAKSKVKAKKLRKAEPTFLEELNAYDDPDATVDLVKEWLRKKPEEVVDNWDAVRQNIEGRRFFNGGIERVEKLLISLAPLRLLEEKMPQTLASVSKELLDPETDAALIRAALERGDALSDSVAEKIIAQSQEKGHKGSGDEKILDSFVYTNVPWYELPLNVLVNHANLENTLDLDRLFKWRNTRDDFEMGNIRDAQDAMQAESKLEGALIQKIRTTKESYEVELLGRILRNIRTPELCSKVLDEVKDHPVLTEKILRNPFLPIEKLEANLDRLLDPKQKSVRIPSGTIKRLSRDSLKKLGNFLANRIDSIDGYSGLNYDDLNLFRNFVSVVDGDSYDDLLKPFVDRFAESLNELESTFDIGDSQFSVGNEIRRWADTQSTALAEKIGRTLYGAGLESAGNLLPPTVQVEELNRMDRNKQIELASKMHLGHHEQELAAAFFEGIKDPLAFIAPRVNGANATAAMLQHLATRPDADSIMDTALQAASGTGVGNEFAVDLCDHMRLENRDHETISKVVDKMLDGIARLDPDNISSEISAVGSRLSFVPMGNGQMMRIASCKGAFNEVAKGFARAFQEDEGRTISPEHEAVLKHIASLEEAFPVTRKYANEALARNNPDLAGKKVSFSIGTSKARKIRDLIVEQTQAKNPELHPDELSGREAQPKTLPNWPKVLAVGRMPNGNISAAKIQSWIDAQDKHTYNVTESEWNGAQRHNSDPSRVFQLNCTADQINQIRADPELEKTYKEWHRQNFRRGHPANKWTLGWVRFTHRPGQPAQEVGSGIPTPVTREQEESIQRIRDVMNSPHVSEEQRRNFENHVAKLKGQKVVLSPALDPEFFIDEIQSDLGISLIKDPLKAHFSDMFDEHLIYAREAQTLMRGELRRRGLSSSDFELKGDKYVLTDAARKAQRARRGQDEPPRTPDEKTLHLRNIRYHLDNNPSDDFSIDAHSWPIFFSDEGTPEFENALRAQVERHPEYTDEAERAERTLPKEHMNKIFNILFKGQHPSVMLFEGFNQWLRDQGHHGAKIAIHDTESKGVLSGLDMESVTSKRVIQKGKDGKPIVKKLYSRNIPGHQHLTYNQIPKDAGWTPGVYGNHRGQDGRQKFINSIKVDEETGNFERKDRVPAPTHEDVIRKHEEMDIELQQFLADCEDNLLG